MPKFWISVYILKMALREAMFPLSLLTSNFVVKANIRLHSGLFSVCLQQSLYGRAIEFKLLAWSSIAQSVCEWTFSLLAVGGHSVCCRFGSRDPLGSKPAFGRGRQLVSFPFENRLPVPEHRNNVCMYVCMNVCVYVCVLCTYHVFLSTFRVVWNCVGDINTSGIEQETWLTNNYQVFSLCIMI